MTTAAGGQAPEIETGLVAPEPGPRTPAPFGRRPAAVIANEAIGPYRLIAVRDRLGPEPRPGQFYMLACARHWGGGEGERPYLARAFSVCRVRGERLEFLLEQVGPGTARLAALQSGDQALLVGPLGVGFRTPAELSRTDGRPGALLIGGGAGVAPLAIWSEALVRSGTETLTLLGFRSAPYCDAAKLLAGEVALATDDGSAGHHGFVTELLAQKLEHADRCAVYACGPPPMLESVRSICAAHSVPAELALEETMACGFGACFGCVVRTRKGYRRICVDGPVVSADDLDQSWLEQ